MLYNILHFFEPMTHPIGALWVLCLIAAGVLIWKKQRLGAVLFGVMALLMSLIGSSISKALLHSLEKPWIRAGYEAIPEADAIVLLGGGYHASKHDLSSFNLNDAGDRITTAVELARRGKAPVLVLGGSTYRKGDEEEHNLADLIEPWVRDQLPETKTIVMGVTANTYEEAAEIRDMMAEHDWRKIILVTSAYHMTRSVSCFNATGVPTEPVACDFQIRGVVHAGFSPFPNPNGFHYLALYIHEKLGWIVYRMKGWVSTEAPEPLEPAVDLPEEKSPPVNESPGDAA